MVPAIQLSSGECPTAVPCHPPPDVSELPIIKDGLPHLEPDHVCWFPLGTLTPEEFERAARNPWRFSVKCEDLYDKRHTFNFIMDFSLFKGTMFELHYLQEISAQLKSRQLQISSQLAMKAPKPVPKPA